MRYLTVLLLGLLASTLAHASSPPNVLLIITDDQGFGDVSSHGNPHIKTPHHDRLAASGARFDRYFVSPVCAPTRAALLIGRYALKTGVAGVTRGYENMRPSEITIAELLGGAGYRTGAFGKWHNGRHMPYHPNGQGFDTFVGFCGGHWNTYFDAPLERNGEIFKSIGYIADVTTDEAITFMKAAGDDPFFCYVAYNTPHSPWRMPEKDWQRYNSLGLDTKAQAAYAMVDNIDQNLGRLLEALEASNLANNTIVLFMTDNGANSDRFNAGMRGRKGSLDEGGTRVPLFVRYPGAIEPGTLVKKHAFHLDILPTLAEWCGVALTDQHQASLDGRSIVPLLTDSSAEQTWPDRPYFAERFNLRNPRPVTPGAVRTERWRAVRYSNPWKLYDMAADPGQTRDVASEHPDIVEDLAAQFDVWLTDIMKNPPVWPAIPVGHPLRTRFELPANEALLAPGYGDQIKWTGDSNSGWSNSWITDWTSQDAYPHWRIDVLTPGQYRATLRYTCSRQNIGTQMQLTTSNRTLVANVGDAYDPSLMDKPDRLYSTNYQDKPGWLSLDMGTLTLEAGETQLKLTTKIARDRSIDLKSIVLERLP